MPGVVGNAVVVPVACLVPALVIVVVVVAVELAVALVKVAVVGISVAVSLVGVHVVVLMVLLKATVVDGSVAVVGDVVVAAVELTGLVPSPWWTCQWQLWS